MQYLKSVAVRVAVLYGDVLLYSGFTGYAANAVAAAEAKVQNSGSFLDRGIKRPNSQATELFIDEQLMRLDKQVQVWGRVDVEQVRELLELVKRNG